MFSIATVTPVRSSTRGQRCQRAIAGRHAAIGTAGASRPAGPPPRARRGSRCRSCRSGRRPRRSASAAARGRGGRAISTPCRSASSSHRPGSWLAGSFVTITSTPGSRSRRRARTSPPAAVRRTPRSTAARLAGHRQRLAKPRGSRHLPGGPYPVAHVADPVRRDRCRGRLRGRCCCASSLARHGQAQLLWAIAMAMFAAGVAAADDRRCVGVDEQAVRRLLGVRRGPQRAVPRRRRAGAAVPAALDALGRVAGPDLLRRVHRRGAPPGRTSTPARSPSSCPRASRCSATGPPHTGCRSYFSYPAYSILLAGALWSAWKMRGRPELRTGSSARC